MRHSIFILLPLTVLLAGCLPEPEPAVDEATVLGDNTSVRADASSSARTLFTLNEGERVAILEKRGTWYRIRDRDQLGGWMDESTVLTDTTLEAMREALVIAATQPVQVRARAREPVNLRLQAGRDTAIIRRLRRGTELEILDRATTPRTGDGAAEVWFKVRPSDSEVGWVYSQLVDLETPVPLQGFMEGRAYTSVQQLKRTEDPEVGPRDWYVVAERRADTEPSLDFDGIRVFVWNLGPHRYETTLRLRNLRGIYPLERTGNNDNPGFRFHVEGPDGEPIAREFEMRGTLPREIRN